MSFIPVPNCAQAIIEYGNSSYPWTNTLWFYKASFGLSEMEDLADALTAGLVADLQDVLADGWNTMGMTIYDMNSESAPTFTPVWAPSPGGLSGAEANISGACVVTFRTNNRGRSYRGRNYVTGFTEEVISAIGVGQSEVANAVAAAYNGMKTDVAAAGWTWVVVSRYHNGSPRSAGVYTPVTIAEVRSTTFGTQRRRLRRG